MSVMDRNTVFAFVLLAIVFLLIPLYYQVVNPPVKNAEVQSIDSLSTTGKSPVDSSVSSPMAKSTRQPTTTPTRKPEEVYSESLLVDNGELRNISVETDLYKAVFSTKGASLKSFMLKKYRKSNGDIINLVGQNGGNTLLLKNDNGYLAPENLIYSIDVNSLDLSPTHKTDSLVFQWEDKIGDSIRKVYRFENGKYSFSVDLYINGLNSLGCSKGYYLGWETPMPITEASAKEDLNYMGGYVMFGGEILDFKSVDKKEGLDEEKSGQTSWVADKSKYFTVAIVPKSRAGNGFYIRGNSQPMIIGEQNVDRKFINVGLRMSSNNADSLADSFLIYLGPIDYYVLKGYGVGLEGLVYMGWSILKPFSVAMLWLLTALHKFIPNYGIVLILVAVILKVAFFPLTRKSTASMSKMQEIQPKIQEIKDKYKKDPKRMNAETMKLYKEHGVNPVGGCLPLLLQMPIFFALYAVLRATIELRGADFLLWITDLSQQDPYYVLPILMGATMFFQQKMTVKDPKQKMMVYIMPIVLTFIFLKMPAGLVLYWAVFNVLSLIEQIYNKRKTQPTTKAVTG